MAAAPNTAPRPKLAGLYALTPDLVDTHVLSMRTASALAGGAAAVQYRNKSGSAALKLEQADALRVLCAAHRAIFIVNDDVELARVVGADGVHLGRDDANVGHARARLGAGALIGASCYDSLERAQAAAGEGASYLAFGSFYPSRVKPDAVRPQRRLIAEAKASWPQIDIVAIGGITAANAAPLVAAGADALAVLSALYDAPDIGLAARELVACFR
ncbi:MAG TPA: thiamine phosphate synthase [Casimicrobiaceae bacterium]